MPGVHLRLPDILTNRGNLLSTPINNVALLRRKRRLPFHWSCLLCNDTARHRAGC